MKFPLLSVPLMTCGQTVQGTYTFLMFFLYGKTRKQNLMNFQEKILFQTKYSLKVKNKLIKREGLKLWWLLTQ